MPSLRISPVSKPLTATPADKPRVICLEKETSPFYSKWHQLANRLYQERHTGIVSHVAMNAAQPEDWKTSRFQISKDPGTDFTAPICWENGMGRVPKIALHFLCILPFPLRKGFPYNKDNL